MAEELRTFFFRLAGALLMTRTIDLNLEVDNKISAYVDFLNQDLNADETLQEVLLQPFYSRYDAFRLYREDLNENDLKTINVSLSPILKEAIEIKRESNDQTDDEILEKILLDHLGL
jgi:hypothetical protein